MKTEQGCLIPTNKLADRADVLVELCLSRVGKMFLRQTVYEILGLDDFGLVKWQILSEIGAEGVEYLFDKLTTPSYPPPTIT